MALYTMMSLCVLCSEEHLEMQAAKEMELRREVERKLATEKKNRGNYATSKEIVGDYRPIMW